MAKKTTLPPEIAQLAEGVEEYNEAAFQHSERPAADYTIEEDPILAVGDNRVHVPTEPIIQLAKDPEDPMAKLAASIEKLAERQAGPSPVDPTLMALLAGMMSTMQSLVQQQVVGNQGAAEAIRRSQDPSNMFAPDVSVFNPRGERDHPRPNLACPMFLPWEAEKESLTREEIELLNLLEPGEFYVRRNDESKILVTIKTTTNPNTGKHDRLLMNSETGFNNDYHWLIPPLRQTLRQILNQRAHTKEAATKVLTMEREIELITEHGVDFEKVLALRETVNA